MKGFNFILKREQKFCTDSIFCTEQKTPILMFTGQEDERVYQFLLAQMEDFEKEILFVDMM